MFQEGARCGQMWTCSLERCVSFPIEEREWNGNMSTEQGEKEACGERLHRAHLISIPVAHSPEAGDQTHQLYHCTSYTVPHCKGEKKSFLAAVNQLAGFSELLVRLCTPKHALSRASAIPRHLHTISSHKAEEGYLG